MSNPKVSVILSIFRAERYLERYLKSVLNQSMAHAIELSIVHNDPTNAERDILDEYATQIQMVRTETSRERLYVSWNRSIAQSRGDFLACWNVDDLRIEDSLERMTMSLEADIESGWTYGDFVVTNQFGSQKGHTVVTPEWSRHLATRGAIGGPFFLWRRRLMHKVGWFDEQFASGGDFDFTVRLSLHSRGVRSPGIHGYFLNERSGLSTSGDLQPVERTVVQLRYGIYETLDSFYLNSSLKYRVRHILQPGHVWIPIEYLLPGYDQLIKHRHRAAWRIPFHTAKAAIARRLRSVFRGR